MDELESILKDSQSKRFRIVVTDGVFSMDGTIAKLKDITDLAQKYNALVFVDECHGTGVVGKKGRGAVEEMEVLSKVDIISSTMGKALGGANGGFITGRKEIVDYLRQKARPYIFSNALSQSTCAASIKAFDILINQPSLIQKLRNNVSYFRE